VNSVEASWLYAAISILLSAASFGCFVLYGYLHHLLISPFGHEMDWLVGIAGGLQNLFTPAALICALIAIRKGPWWAGLVALLLALAVGTTMLVTF
jgi:hypothetical protein